MQCGDHCSESDSIDEITLKKWKNIEDQSKKWIVLDTFESVFTAVDQKLDPAGLFMHDSCYIRLCRARKLAQAEKRKKTVAERSISG